MNEEYKVIAEKLFNYFKKGIEKELEWSSDVNTVYHETNIYDVDATKVELYLQNCVETYRITNHPLYEQIKGHVEWLIESEIVGE